VKFEQEGLITDIRYIPLGEGKRCEVKVDVDGRSTPWLEVRTRVTKFYKEFTPPSINDQSIVHNPNGADNENAYVEIGTAYESVPLPNDINENKIVRWVKDGTTYIHDAIKKKVTFDTPCEINIKSSSKINCKAPKIILDGEVEITKNLKVSKKIHDEKGNLTDHQHAVQNHSVAVPR